jgi:hypothetical protein
MTSLFVVTQITNTKNIAGIPHNHAIANIDGAAIFGFRKLPLAARFAKAIDHRIATNSDYVFCEDLIEPFSNLSKGQVLSFNYPREITENVNFDNVIIGRVKESEVVAYCSALQISTVMLQETSESDSLYVEDILSPTRSLQYSAGFLDYLYHMEDSDLD